MIVLGWREREGCAGKRVEGWDEACARIMHADVACDGLMLCMTGDRGGGCL